MFLTDLQDTTLALDFRVSVLEENGGDGGNSSVAELEVRVETLEGTASDHETRISVAEVDIDGNVSKLSMKCFILIAMNFIVYDLNMKCVLSELTSLFSRFRRCYI